MNRNSWVQTYSGIKFWPLNPNSDDIVIEDIAHALSNLCRYNGHSKRFYSVAEHSLYVSRLVPTEFALEGLLDDAAEAYIGDMVRPIKYNILDYRIIDDNLTYVIKRKFGLPDRRSQEVIEIDNAILIDESEQVMGGQVDDWEIGSKGTGVKIQFLIPELVEMEFLARFEELTN